MSFQVVNNDDTPICYNRVRVLYGQDGRLKEKILVNETEMACINPGKTLSESFHFQEDYNDVNEGGESPGVYVQLIQVSGETERVVYSSWTVLPLMDGAGPSEISKLMFFNETV